MSLVLTSDRMCRNIVLLSRLLTCMFVGSYILSYFFHSPAVAHPNREFPVPFLVILCCYCQPVQSLILH